MVWQQLMALFTQIQPQFSIRILGSDVPFPLCKAKWIIPAIVQTPLTPAWDVSICMAVI